MEVKAMRIKAINGKPYVKRDFKSHYPKPSIGIMKHNEAVYNAAEEIILSELIYS